jgi:hypothetical protein
MDLTAASPPAVRTVEIGPPSARAETWNVLRVATLIVLATWIYLADTAAPGRGAAGTGDGAGAAAAAGPGTAAGGTGTARERDLMPFQRLFGSLGGEDQRMFRELQEGLLEAENARSATGRWPAPAALAEQGIPPFAAAAGVAGAAGGAKIPAGAMPGDAGGARLRGGGAAARRLYRWELRREGLVVNYLGVPADGRDPAFLLLVQEPDPRVPPAAAAGQAVDEVHHRLADGTLLHVSTWMRAAAPPAAASGAGDLPGVIVEPFARGWTQLLAGAVRQ